MCDETETLVTESDTKSTCPVQDPFHYKAKCYEPDNIDRFNSVSIPWHPSQDLDDSMRIPYKRSIVDWLQLEINGRPPTVMPGRVKMAYGRANLGYYAPRYPIQSDVPCLNPHLPLAARQRTHDKEPPGLMQSALGFTSSQYDRERDLRRSWIESTSPFTTEYQDAYIGQLPSRVKQPEADSKSNACYYGICGGGRRAFF